MPSFKQMNTAFMTFPDDGQQSSTSLRARSWGTSSGERLQIVRGTIVHMSSNAECVTQILNPFAASRYTKGSEPCGS